MHICIFGGQYGSEGKGSYSEYCAKRMMPGRELIVAGENSPNSGHTCSLGKVQNLPAASFFADSVLLGPDSVISVLQLYEDLKSIKFATNKSVPVYIHENAAWCLPSDKVTEKEDGVVERISSTGSGSGAARFRKQYRREALSTIKSIKGYVTPLPDGVKLLTTKEYQLFVAAHDMDNWLFECSQGVMLDVNFGRFPYVTSRSTLPRVAIERNGLGGMFWQYEGVYRTFPIRTGGPSGPTGGVELTWKDVGVEPEIATVTRRVRRVFAFDSGDFLTSVRLTRPDALAFTHLDYLKQDFQTWAEDNGIGGVIQKYNVSVSRECGKFERWKT